MKKPRILLFDIETSPNVALTWGKYEQNVLGDFIQERRIICFAYKWFGESEVQTCSLPDYYGYKKYFPTKRINNLKVIEKLHSLFNAADILVGQNSDEFDIKMANAEFVEYGMEPTHPTKSIDTKKVARAKFRFNSNSLDDMGKRLGLGRKLKHEGFDMWVDCLMGKPAAWKKMIEYNRQDVILLDKIYKRFRPWMQSHPNMNVFDGRGGCPVCRSKSMVKAGLHMTKRGTRQRWHCKNPSCGHWSLGAFVSAGLDWD